MAKVLVFVALCFSMLAGFDGDIFAVKPLSKLKTKHTVRQAYEESCGAAALATLFRLYGKDTNETQILEEVDKSDMLSFEELGRISLKFGFLTDGYKINRSVFEKIRIPILALVVREADFPHFEPTAQPKPPPSLLQPFKDLKNFPQQIMQIILL